MSFFLDPPVLFILGMLVYYLEKRNRWDKRITFVVGATISVCLFIVGSSLLYLDVVDWPFPPREGPEWMFHTRITGIQKANFPVVVVVSMFALYPAWHLLGYALALRMDIGSYLLPEASYSDVKSRKRTSESRVSVARGPSPRGIAREAVESLGGMGEFVRPGDRVLIKPNICGGNPLTPGSYTSVDVVDEIVTMVREVGGDPSVVDSDMIWTKFEPVAEAQGWVDWSRRTGVRLVNLADTEKVRFNFGRESTIGLVPVSRELVDADVIISVPTMKTHLLTSVTLAMKNMYGTFPEENKAKYHRLGIEGVIYEVNKAFTPGLTVVDGTIGGEAWGPLSCTPVNFETVVASNDVVAADAVCCRLMGYDPMEIVHIKRAHDEGLGDATVEFDMDGLPYPKEVDGRWQRPDSRVSVFYEGVIEATLLMPGMQSFFDIAADFVLYGTATIPQLKEATPRVERALNDIVASLLRSGSVGTRWTEEDLKRLWEKITKR